jgi:hypothetical protein
MRRLTILALALLAVAAVAAPALAAGTRIDVPRKFKKLLPGVKQKSGIAVRLPSKLDVGIRPKRVFGTASSSKGKYDLELGVGKHCNSGTACFVGAFFGERGGKRTNPVKVKLAHGIKGRWRDISCGASCAPASIQWKQGGVLYEIQVKGSKRKLVRLANQAIKAGPR